MTSNTWRERESCGAVTIVPSKLYVNAADGMLAEPKGLAANIAIFTLMTELKSGT